jgi:hypothetical protein
MANFPISFDADSSLLVATNFCRSTVATDMTNVQNTCVLASAALFPNPAGATYYAVIDAQTSSTREIIGYTGITGNTLTGVTRAQRGTTASAHLTGVLVEQNIVDAYHEFVKSAIIAIEVKMGIDTSAVTTTVDFKLGEVTAGDKAVGKTATQTLTNKTLTSPAINTATIIGGTATALTGLAVRSTGAAFDLTLANSDVFTAGRTLTMNIGDASRLISLSGNLTFAGALTTAGAFGITLTVTGNTSVSLPLAGTLATLAGVETFTNKTLTSPAINTATIIGGTATALTGLAVRSTGAAFDLTLAATEVLTAGRTLTLILNDVARTINLAGNLTLVGALTTAGAFTTAAAFTTAGAFGVTLTATGTTGVTLPVSGTLASLNLIAPFTRQYTVAAVSVASSAAPAFDWNNSNVQYFTFPAGNVTGPTFSNPVEGGRYMLHLTQDAVGSRTFAWPAAFHWPGATAPVLSGANKSDIVGAVYRNGVYWATAALNYT